METQREPRAVAPDAGSRAWLAWAAFFGLTGVMAGAFGAHALRGRLAQEALAVFETAARYQLLHAVALLAVAALVGQAPHRWLRLAARSLTLGVIVFSGSLYALALTGQRWWGAVTPAGGLLLMLGWLALLVAALRPGR